MKKNTNAIISVSVKLDETGVKDKYKKSEKITRTIKGLKIWLFKIQLFLIKPRKF